MSKRVTTVLMLGGAKRVSLARLLQAAGEQRNTIVRILSYEITPTVPIAAVGEVIMGRRWRDADILDDLTNVILREGVDIVLPFVDGAIEVAARLKERNPETFIPVSPFDVAHAMFDKAEAARVFEQADIPIPATYSAENCSYPAILKPREGSASKGIRIVYNREDLAEISDINKYLLQEYIADREEYTVDCYVSVLTGAVKCTVPRLRISTSGGEVDRTQTRRIAEIMEMSENILNKLKFRGPVTLQFLHDKSTNRYLLMEINPRLGGGVVCSILANADIPKMLLCEADGIEARRCDDWRDNALMARYFSEVMFYEDDEQR